jgi:hypothetical protein
MHVGKKTASPEPEAIPVFAYRQNNTDFARSSGRDRMGALAGNEHTAGRGNVDRRKVGPAVRSARNIDIILGVIRLSFRRSMGWRYSWGRLAALLPLLAAIAIVLSGNGTARASADDEAAIADEMSAESRHNGGLAIVKNGRANAVVVVAADADAQTRKAANTLVEYVEKSTGVKLAVMTEQQALAGGTTGQVRMYIGDAETKERPFITKRLEGMKDDGFLIRPHADSVTIVGPTPWGTEYGVYEFLERYVGVRWLMPGPDGEDVPALRDVYVPRKEVREEPSTISRMFSPFQNINSPDVQVVWARKNRIHGTVEFGHNLWSIFPPELYGETHPEFYPMRDGVRKIPAPGVKTGWQPCFSEEGTIPVAVNYILEYFRTHPDATSFSLGMNDAGGSCESDPAHPRFPNKLNSVGTQHLSDIYFEWVNRVVEEVRKVYPDKWFGLLAYAETADPPSFQVNDHVIPFIAKDRLMWADDGIREQDQRLIREWADRADNIALYDYLYGTPYLVPRMYTQLFDDTMKFAASAGVAAHYMELYPNWGEGPKAWIAAKLMWDPTQNVDKLLKEWYDRAVGPEAAPYLKAYYELWEKLWTEKVPQTEWFNTYKTKSFLVFAIPNYMKVVSDADAAKSRQLIDEVVAKAQTDRQKARAKLLLRAFEYYEASVYGYPRRSEPPANETEAKTLIRQGVNELVYGYKKSALLDEFAKDPVLKHWLNAKSYFNLNYSGWNPYHFWNVVDYIAQNERNGGPVRNELARLADQGETDLSRRYGQMSMKAVAGQFTRGANLSFEDGAETAPPWTFAVRSTGSFTRVEGKAHSGNASILAQGVDWGQTSQTIDVQPGLLHAQAYFYTPAGLKTNGAIRLYAYLLDEQGNQIGSLTPEVTLVQQTAGTWSDIRMIREVPADVKGVPVKRVKFDVNVEALKATDELYLDDADVYNIPANG